MYDQGHLHVALLISTTTLSEMLSTRYLGTTTPRLSSLHTTILEGKNTQGGECELLGYVRALSKHQAKVGLQLPSITRRACSFLPATEHQMLRTPTVFSQSAPSDLSRPRPPTLVEPTMAPARKKAKTTNSDSKPTPSALLGDFRVDWLVKYVLAHGKASLTIC